MRVDVRTRAADSGSGFVEQLEIPVLASCGHAELRAC